MPDLCNICGKPLSEHRDGLACRKACSVGGCEKPVKRHDTMCSMHRARLTRTGRLDRPGIVERIMRRSRREGACLLWKGNAVGIGYGRIRHDGQYVLAHRAIYAAHHGPIPEGMCVCHTCDHPACVEIAHLFIGTHEENMADMMQKGRGVFVSGTRHWCARLTEDDVARIRECTDTSKSLAAELGVSRCAINDIRSGRTWNRRALTAAERQLALYRTDPAAVSVAIMRGDLATPIAVAEGERERARLTAERDALALKLAEMADALKAGAAAMLETQEKGEPK